MICAERFAGWAPWTAELFWPTSIRFFPKFDFSFASERNLHFLTHFFSSDIVLTVFLNCISFFLIHFAQMSHNFCTRLNFSSKRFLNIVTLLFIVRWKLVMIIWDCSLDHMGHEYFLFLYLVAQDICLYEINFSVHSISAIKCAPFSLASVVPGSLLYLDLKSLRTW